MLGGSLLTGYSPMGELWFFKRCAASAGVAMPIQFATQGSAAPALTATQVPAVVQSPGGVQVINTGAIAGKTGTGGTIGGVLAGRAASLNLIGRTVGPGMAIRRTNAQPGVTFAGRTDALGDLGALDTNTILLLAGLGLAGFLLLGKKGRGARRRTITESF